MRRERGGEGEGREVDEKAEEGGGGGVREGKREGVRGKS